MQFFPANLIARAAGTCKRTIQRRAIRERWPVQQHGNRNEFVPPRSLLAKCRRLAARSPSASVRVEILSHQQRAEIARATHRLHTIAAFAAELRSGTPRERALVQVARAFNFACSPSSLRRWELSFSCKGFLGLMEQKRGRSGRKPSRK